MSASAAAAPSASASLRREFDPSKPRSDRGQAEYRATQEALTPPVIAPTVTSFFASIRWLLLGALACALFSIAVQFLDYLKVLRTIVPHHHTQCRRVLSPGAAGCEDLALDRHGITIVSCDPREWIPNMERDGVLTGPNVAIENMKTLPAEVRGGFWAYDTRPASASSTAGTFVKMEIVNLPDYVTDLNPHGISIPHFEPSPSDSTASEAAAPIYLYAANHARTGDHVLVFTIEYTRLASGGIEFPPKLTYVTQIDSPAHLTGVNDLDALYPVDQADGSRLHTVFVSNFLGSALGDAIPSAFEVLTRRPWGTVALCQARQVRLNEDDPDRTDLMETSITQCRTAMSDMCGPNGVVFSGDARRLYLAATFDEQLHTYDLDDAPAAMVNTVVKPETERSIWTHGTHQVYPFRLNSTLDMGTGVDNLSVDRATGDVFIGAHPRLIECVGHMGDHTKSSPLQVLRVRVAESHLSPRTRGEQPTPVASAAQESHLSPSIRLIEEVYTDLGVDGFAGSSSAVWNRATQELLIGTIYSEGIRVCPYPAADQAP